MKTATGQATVTNYAKAPLVVISLVWTIALNAVITAELPNLNALRVMKTANVVTRAYTVPIAVNDIKCPKTTSYNHFKGLSNYQHDITIN